MVFDRFLVRMNRAASPTTISAALVSSKPSNYMVQIAFVTPDGATQLDTASVMVNGLAPGQASEQVASSFKAELRKQAMTCKVLDVTRFAA